MKKIFFPLILAVAVVLSACSPTSRSVDPVKEAAVKAVLDSRDYTIYADRMTPRRIPPITLTYPFNIRISGDSVYSYLPYFGEAYTPVIGRPDGLVFDAPITDYKTADARRGATDIAFSARTFEDRFDFRITVYPNGNASIFVNPDRKESISFEGYLELEER